MRCTQMRLAVIFCVMCNPIVCDSRNNYSDIRFHPPGHPGPVARSSFSGEYFYWLTKPFICLFALHRALQQLSKKRHKCFSGSLKTVAVSFKSQVGMAGTEAVKAGFRCRCRLSSCRRCSTLTPTRRRGCCASTAPCSACWPACATTTSPSPTSLSPVSHTAHWLNQPGWYPLLWSVQEIMI